MSKGFLLAAVFIWPMCFLIGWNLGHFLMAVAVERACR